MTKKNLNRMLWAVQVLLTVLFLFTGGMKLSMPAEVLAKQVPLPVLFVKFIGLCEVLGAAGLILPGLLRTKRALTPLAAGGLVIIMTGATIATLVTGGGAVALLPAVVGTLLVLVARGRAASGATEIVPFRVQRSISVQAPREEVFALLNDFRQWPSWSPYENIDPEMTRTYSGASAGKGAVYQWSGNRKAGAGRMEIVENFQPHRIAIQLDFLKPFEGHHTAEFTLATGRDAIQVTWAMFGPQSYFCQVMSLFFDMDQMIGKEFEKGLANLKSVAELAVERPLSVA